MPRPKTRRPKYRRHISGQAVVMVDGRDYYLGVYDTDELDSRYRELIAMYQFNGLRTPDDVDTRPPAPKKKKKKPKVTVGMVLNTWRDHVKERREEVAYRPLCTVLDVEYADVPAKEFGPRMPTELRETLEAGWKQSRKWINEQTKAVQRIFTHAVAVELIKHKCTPGC